MEWGSDLGRRFTSKEAGDSYLSLGFCNPSPTKAPACMLFTPMGPPLYLHTIASILGYKELVDIGASLGFGLLLAI